MSHKKFVGLVVAVLGLALVLESAFAQPTSEAVAPPRRPQTGAPPRGVPSMNPMVLRRAYEDMTREYRQIEQILGQIDPRDQRLQETLKSQRDAISEQLRDVMTQLEQHGIELPSPPPTSLRSESPVATDDAAAPETKPAVNEPRNPTVIRPREIPSLEPEPRRRPNPQPAFPAMPAGEMNQQPFASPPAGMAAPTDQLLWNTSPIGQRTFDEIATLRTTVESLRSEVTSLREEIKNLTVQIQLLTRSVAGVPSGER